MDAIGSHQPFYLPYQGRNDRELQSLYGAAVCSALGARFATPSIAAAASRARADQARDRQRILPPAFELEDSHQGLAEDAQPGPVSRLRLPHRALNGTARRLRLRPCAMAFVQGRSRSKAGEARSARMRLTCCCSRKSAWTRSPRSLRACAWPRSSARPGDIRSPAVFRPSITSSAAISWNRLMPRCTIRRSWSGCPIFRSTTSRSMSRPVQIDRAELGLRGDAVVYWCAQSLPKYLPQYDEVFARIASEVPRLPVCLHRICRRQGRDRDVSKPGSTAHSMPSV